MTKHQKRIAAPRVLMIARKRFKWSFRSAPGGHPLERSVPLAALVRDYLALCATGREAKRIIGSGDIVVDGRPRKEATYPVGLMDVVEVPKLKRAYRMLADPRGRLIPVPIAAAEAAWKLCQVQDKTVIKGGRTQVNLHDGRNLLVPKDEHSTGDVLKISVPEQKVLGTLKFAKGMLALVTAGAHSGQLATIDEVVVKRGPYPTIVALKSEKGETIRTIKQYVFPVGEKTPEITLPEVSALAG